MYLLVLKNNPNYVFFFFFCFLFLFLFFVCFCFCFCFCFFTMMIPTSNTSGPRPKVCMKDYHLRRIPYAIIYQRPATNMGGGLVFEVGYHPRKRTFKTHSMHVFFKYENRPEFRVFACFFLNFFHYALSKIGKNDKNHNFCFSILHDFAPLNDVRTYIAWSWCLDVVRGKPLAQE